MPLVLRTSLLLLALSALATSACRKSPEPPPASEPPAAEPPDAEASNDSDADASGDPSCELVREDYGPDGTVKVRAEKVATGLEVPWALAFLPDGDVLVTERPGRLRLIHDGKLVEAPVATIPVTSKRGNEGGLLGMALAPDFETSRAFFLYYTHEKGGGEVNRVERWKLASDARSATPEKVILDDIPAARFHDGGRIHIGPDGMLYVGTGDATSPESAQEIDSLAGKLLRMSPDGAIPSDNPWPGEYAFLRGIRNLQGFDFRGDGALFIASHGPTGEFGWRGHDQVSVAREGDNLGWPVIYGCETHEGMVTPAISWVHPTPPGGATIYRGDVIPEWKGSLMLGILGGKHLHRLVFDGDRVAKHEVYFRGEPPEGLGRIRDVANGPDGALWLTTSNCDGRGECPSDKDWIVRVTK